MAAYRINREKREEFLNRLDSSIQEGARILNIAQNASPIMEEYDEEFSRKTGLTKVDWGFLFVATGLQVARQYLLTMFPERLNDKEAANRTLGHVKEHSNRSHRYYNPSLEEIITNPVPFDANVGANGELHGGGYFGHRGRTLGHDPLLGLIFGTANIATSTLTTTSFDSYHIKTGQLSNGVPRDMFGNHASTIRVLNETADKITNQGLDGKKKVAAALVKEVVHLNSDVGSKKSLPLPVIGAFKPELSSFLAGHGIDAGNLTVVGRQAAFALLINTVISITHALFYAGASDEEWNIYKVRTHKILVYSNLLATGSNAMVVALTKDFKKLDIGGLCVTLYQLVTSLDFIRTVREDFISGRFVQLIHGN